MARFSIISGRMPVRISTALSSGSLTILVGADLMIAMDPAEAREIAAQLVATADRIDAQKAADAACTHSALDGCECHANAGATAGEG